jgi:hypothetical protein
MSFLFHIAYKLAHLLVISILVAFLHFRNAKNCFVRNCSFVSSSGNGVRLDLRSVCPPHGFGNSRVVPLRLVQGKTRLLLLIRLEPVMLRCIRKMQKKVIARLNWIIKQLLPQATFDLLNNTQIKLNL